MSGVLRVGGRLFFFCEVVEEFEVFCIVVCGGWEFGLNSYSFGSRFGRWVGGEICLGLL